MRRVVVAGGEAELAELLELHVRGVEEIDGGFAVYTDDDGERALRGRFARVSATSVAEGWEEAWREFHHGVVVGRFWIGPPWEQAPPGAEAVVIDPGRAFGTGGHATTRLALELLQELDASSALDVGCGSGVLSIAAAKLGFDPVFAVDNEQDAVEVAQANARANGVHVQTRLADALVDDLPAVRVVLANIALEPIERLLGRIDCGFVVASGYLDRDRPSTPGWTRVERRDREGWAADLLVRD